MGGRVLRGRNGAVGFLGGGVSRSLGVGRRGCTNPLESRMEVAGAGVVRPSTLTRLHRTLSGRGMVRVVQSRGSFWSEGGAARQCALSGPG